MQSRSIKLPVRDYSKEIQFWEEWFRDRGGIYASEYERRLKRNLPFDERLLNFIPRHNLKSLKILDAGAGPISSLGRIIDGQEISITAIDPLATEYQKLYRKFNYEPAVITQTGDFKNLVSDFGDDAFDFVYSRNSLDHSDDPVLSIINLVRVCKPGCYIFFENAEAEATRENGQGLHEWDFLVEHGEFTVQNYVSKNKTTLSQILDVMVKSVHVSLKNEWIEVTIQK